jgi:predicted metalloprotease
MKLSITEINKLTNIVVWTDDKNTIGYQVNNVSYAENAEIIDAQGVKQYVLECCVNNDKNRKIVKFMIKTLRSVNNSKVKSWKNEETRETFINDCLNLLN